MSAKRRGNDGHFLTGQNVKRAAASFHQDARIAALICLVRRRWRFLSFETLEQLKRLDDKLRHELGFDIVCALENPDVLEVCVNSDGYGSRRRRESSTTRDRT
jgi:hypothetical protein